jgi:hypothetical protein
VDGGKHIVMERNHVYDCNFAVSVGSENTGKVVTNVIVRNNILHHCHVGGIVIGGSGPTNGGADNCAFSHNTIYDNDTTISGGGQVMIQNYVTNTTITRNIIASTASFAQLVLKDNTTGSIAAGAIDWNLYQTDPGASIEFIWNGTAYSTFASWKSAGSTAKDQNSYFITAALGLTNNSPTVTSPATDFSLTLSSPARDTGDSIALPFTPASGEKDYFGQSRIANSRVDIGADEYLSAFQAWRDLYFALPDGGGIADVAADPDQDGVSNLIEYSQGMNPTLPDTQLQPQVTRITGTLYFTFHKTAPELIYTPLQSQNLASWTPTALPTLDLGSALFGIALPAGPSPQFIRLQVALP